MSQQEIKINICLSKRFRPGAYEILKTAFTSNREAGLIAHKFDLRLFRSNCQKYMQDDMLRNHLKQTLNIESVQELESYIDYISNSAPDIENNSGYLKLERILHDYLYAPEEGKQLLLEYQSVVANEDQIGDKFKISFNDFLRNKLTNIQNFDELKPYPQLYHDVKTQGKYKNVKALAASLKNTKIVADIQHVPQELTNGTGLVLNDFDSIRLLNFLSYDMSWDDASEILRDMDYTPGSEEDRTELFNNGNFCGSTFRNIKFECDLDKVIFQNCTLTNVLFSGNSLNDVDFRGAKLQSTVFDIQDNINGIKLDVNDPGILERIGIAKFDLTQQSLKVDDDMDTSKTIVDDIRQYIGSLEDFKQKTNDMLQSNEQGGWNFVGWYGSIIKNAISTVAQFIPTNLLQNSLSEEQLHASINNLRKEIDSTIENVRQKYGQTSKNYMDLSNEYNQLIVEYEDIKRNQRYQTNLNELPVRVTNVITDSTYRPSEVGKNIVKINIKVKRADIEEFVNSNEINLSRFIQNKYNTKVSDTIKQKQQAHELDDTTTVMVIPDVSGENLSEINFQHKNMSSTILAQCNLSQCNFSNTVLEGTCFEEANVTNATFHNATVLDANMVMISGGGVTFDNATLTNSKFIGAKIGSRSFDGTERVPASFKNAILKNIDIREGDLNSCDFSNTKIQKSDFSYANMIYIDAKDMEMKASTFDQINGYRSNFANSKLNSSSMQEATMAYTDFSNSTLVNADLKRVDARGARFQSANMQGVNAQNSDFTQANLNAVNAQNSDFTQANLNAVNAQNANFSDANLTKSQSNNADFSNANLQSAKLKDGSFISTKFCYANMSTCDITNSDMFKADFDNANMNQVIWNKDTKTLGANIESAKNVPLELEQHHKDQHDITSPIKRMFYSISDKMLNFANVNTDAVQGYVYTAMLSLIVLLSLPVILATSVATLSVAAFVSSPFIVAATAIVVAIGTTAVIVAKAEQIVRYSALTNPIKRVVDQIVRFKNKILSSDSNLAQNSVDISKTKDIPNIDVTSKTVNITKTQSHNTSAPKSNTEKTAQNHNIDTDEVKSKNKITGEDSKIPQQNSTVNRANDSIAKQNIVQSANDTPKVTMNDINGDHAKNQQQNKNDHLNRLIVDNPDVKKLQTNVILDGKKSRVRQSNTHIAAKKDSNSRTP